MVINENASVAYLESFEAAVITNAEKKTSSIKVTSDLITDNTVISPWGEDNLFPQTVLKECRKNTIIGPTLDKQAKIAYEGGIEYGIKIQEGNQVVYKPIIDPRVELFLQRTKIHRYLIGAFRNFYWFYNAFPELVLSNNKKEIYSIKNQNTPYCRWAVQNSKGVVENCYLSSNWEDINVNAPKKEEVITIPAIDIYADPEYLKEEKSFNFIYPISYPTENESYYSLTNWNAVRESGWLDIAQAIPEFKKNLFKNQITIKYHIEVSSFWWNWKYPGFDGFPTNKKQALMKKELVKFEGVMKGTSGAGNSIMTTFFNDPSIKEQYPGWKINAIDDKIKSGTYVEDSNEASSHLLYALGIDPTIIGSQPGSKLGAGSGSDKRVAFNIYSDLIKSDQEIVLEPLNMIAEFNKWSADGLNIKFWMRDLKSKEETPPSKNPIIEPQQQSS